MTPPTIRSLVREWRESALTRSSEREIAMLERCANELEPLLDAQLNRFKPADASNVTAMTIYRIIEEVLGKPEEPGRRSSH